MRAELPADSPLARRSSRRRLLKGAGGLAALLTGGGLLGCQPAARTGAAGPTPAPAAADQEDQPREFTMFVYSGLTERAYRDLFVPSFEAQRGVKVTLDPGWWDMAPKLKVSPADQVPFDLVMTDPTQGFPSIRDGLFTRIDLERAPNARRFAPRVLDSWIYRDGWGVPFISSAMTLAWNSELVTTPFTSWGDLFAEGLKGEIMLYNAYYMSLYTFAAAKAALDGKPGSARQMIENDLDGVLQFARQKRDWVKFWWPSTADAVQALVLKNVKAGNIHGNGLIQPLADAKPLGLVIPPHDRAYVQLFFLVPKNTRSVQVAEDAINFIAGSEFQRAIADKTGELSCNIPEVAAEVAPRNPIWARVYPHSQEDWANLNYYPYDVYDKQASKIVDFWNREILRKTN
ncbi:MAG TPA: ABC transporter substrate-binding protein [Chloroflexota bacterium]|nr:ABC transporter substrate-binding protein [Chloroflexota bacterium]